MKKSFIKFVRANKVYSVGVVILLAFCLGLAVHNDAAIAVGSFLFNGVITATLVVFAVKRVRKLIRK